MMTEILPRQRLLMPSDLTESRPVDTCNNETLRTYEVERVRTENATLRRSLRREERLAEEMRQRLEEKDAATADAHQKLSEQTERYDSAICALQGAETMLAQTQNELDQSNIMLASTRSDLESTTDELQNLQMDHTHLLSITQQSMSVLGQDVPSTFELLLELDHQYTRNRLFERMFAHYLDAGILQNCGQTVQYLDLWHEKIRTRLSLARVDAEHGIAGDEGTSDHTGADYVNDYVQ